MIQFDLLTIFPKIFNSYFNESIIKRAKKKRKISIKVHDFRKFASGRHKLVDDKPYGGDPRAPKEEEANTSAVDDLKI